MRNQVLRHTLAAGVLVALAGLTACSGGSGGSADTMSSQAEDGGAGGSTGSGEVGGSAAKTPEPAGANRTVVRTKSVIRTGQVAVTAQDLGKVRDEIDGLLSALGGSVDNEQTTNDRHGRIERSTLVLRVPVDRFTAAKDALEKMGKLKTSSESAKDVTTQVIDVDERVQTLQNSLDNLQKYQRDARNVTELLRYEDQITERQSELQSLKAQQSYLSDQTSMSTITVYLSTPEKYVPPPDALENAGFLSGLKAGWHALGDFVVVGLTVVGAVLPFLVAGALVAVPTWFGLRTLIRRRRASEPPAAPVES